MELKVVAVSTNRNSFGLRGFVLIARDGLAYEVGASDLHLPRVGDVLAVPTRPGLGLDWGGLGFEVPRRLEPDAPPEVVREVWGEHPTPLAPGRDAPTGWRRCPQHGTAAGR